MTNIANTHRSPLLLSAPMAGFTNYAFRELLRMLGGVDLIATEMVSARAFVMKKSGEEQTESGGGESAVLPRLWGIEIEPRPVCVQIWDNDPDTLVELAAKLVFDYKVGAIDLNFGCPAKQITNRSESGAFLLQFPDRIGNIIQKIARAVPKECELSAKIRLGKTQDTINAVDVAQAVEDAGAVRLTVHGRTAAQMYRGAADWEEIAKIKPKLKNIQLIGNGDIRTVGDALFRLHNYPVDGIMIGRAAVAQPWIFRQIKESLKQEGGVSYAPPPIPQLIARHFELLRRQFDERLSVILLQKMVCHYVAGQPGARKFRNEMSMLRDADEFFRSVNQFFSDNSRPENTEMDF